MPANAADERLFPQQALNGASAAHVASQNYTRAKDRMSSVCGPHALHAEKPTAVQFNLSGNTLESGSSAIYQIAYGTDVTIEIDDLEKSYSISLPLAGKQYVENNAGTLPSDKQKGVIISPSQQTKLHIEGDCVKNLLRISTLKMEQELAGLLHKPLDKPLVFDAIIDAEQGPTAGWWRTVQHIDTELRNPYQFLYKNSAFVQNIESAMITGLLLSQQHNYSQELQQSQQASLPAHLVRALAFIEQNLRNTISTEAIEQAASISRNALYASFKKHFGMPPTLYVKRKRLEASRQDILSGNGSTQITSVAYDWGFTHLGRYAQEYKRLFNETPSETLKRVREQFGNSKSGG